MSLDPQLSLALAVSRSPGVYALLLGSGVSTAAGIPTGWRIVQSLVGDLAAAATPDDVTVAARAAAGPEMWWQDNVDASVPLGYSTLLDQLSNRPAGRDRQLAAFFEATDEDRAEGRKVPGVAHRHIAELVRRGTVRVIVTPNFDRLTQQAIEAVGVQPQILASPEAVRAMTPLVHAACTVFKVHGDYADLDKRNTIDELDQYPDEYTALLTRVFHDHGLLISGWSADYDHALTASLRAESPSRYPIYWATYGQVSPATRDLISDLTATEIPDVTADRLFNDLAGSVEAIDQLREDTLSRDVAVTRLKRALADPTRQIEVHDLLDRAVHQALDHLGSLPPMNTRTPEVFETALAGILATCEPLLHLLATGAYLDDAGSHTHRWVRVINRLLEQPRDSLARYPALLALTVTTLAAVAGDHEDTAVAVLTQPLWYDANDQTRTPMPAAQALHTSRWIDEPSWLNQLPRWANSTGWKYPVSHLLRDELRPVVADLVPADDAYRRLFDGVEFRTALAQNAQMVSGLRSAYQPAWGEWMGERSTTFDDQLTAAVNFTAANRGPWAPVTAPTPIDDAVADLSKYATEHRRGW